MFVEVMQKPLKYAGVLYAVGEPVDVKPRDAKTLIAIRRARAVEVPELAAPVVAAPANTYQTRDLIAGAADLVPRTTHTETPAPKRRARKKKSDTA